MAGECRLGCMPFWVDDWLQDEEVQRMPPVARDAYFWCICLNWRWGSLPADPRELVNHMPVGARATVESGANPARISLESGANPARISRKWKSIWIRTWHEWLAIHFVPCGDGRITNKRLQTEKNRVLTYKQKKVEAGRKGGLKTQAVLQATSQAVLKLPTPTPTPTLEEEEHHHQRKPLANECCMEVNAWNQIATKHGRPKIRELNPDRRAKVRARLKEHPDFWALVLEEFDHLGVWARGQGFLTFDWVICPSNAVKLLEGNYRDKIAAPLPSDNGKTQAELDAEWSAAHPTYDLNGRKVT